MYHAHNMIQEAGTYDTFIVGFDTVAHISVSKTGLVTGQLTAPPGGGPHGALKRRPSGTVPLSLMFKVEVEHAERLYDTLVDRKLVCHFFLSMICGLIPPLHWHADSKLVETSISLLSLRDIQGSFSQRGRQNHISRC